MSNFLVYLIFNIGGIKLFFLIFGAVSLCVLVPLLCEAGNKLFDDEWDNERHQSTLSARGKKQKRLYLISIGILIIFVILGVFLPNKESLIAMQVRNLATVDNYNWTVEQLKGAVDYIVEAINKIGK